MHRYIIFILIGFFCCSALNAQNKESHLKQHQHLNENGMKFLGAFALGNITTGAVLQGQYDDHRKHFHHMNIMWNTVNLGLSASGLFQERRNRDKAFTLGEQIKKQHSAEKIFLFNTALDLAYITTGLWMMDTHSRYGSNSQRLYGYGQSIVVQGTCLAVFDLVMYLLHQRNGQLLLNPVIDKLTLNVGRNSFGIIYQFNDSNKALLNLH
jgi:hypothetical protein